MVKSGERLRDHGRRVTRTASDGQSVAWCNGHQSSPWVCGGWRAPVVRNVRLNSNPQARSPARVRTWRAVHFGRSVGVDCANRYRTAAFTRLQDRVWISAGSELPNSFFRGSGPRIPAVCCGKIAGRDYKYDAVLVGNLIQQCCHNTIGVRLDREICEVQTHIENANTMV